MKKHEENLIEHSYDGVQEYDNPMPLWLTLLFIGSIIFSIGYMAWYHVFDKGVLPVQAWEEEVAAAAAVRAEQRAQAATVDLQALLNDSAALAEGEQVYGIYCASCHAPDGGGLIGPNLRDGTWLHGSGTVTDIVEVVAHGVLDKGMPGWEGVLGIEKVQRVSAWVTTLGR